MFGGSIPRIDILAVNWIIRRVGVGVGFALAMIVAAVIAIVVAFCMARHGVPQASGLIWVKC
jgi:sugar phosphate permease